MLVKLATLFPLENSYRNLVFWYALRTNNFISYPFASILERSVFVENRFLEHVLIWYNIRMIDEFVWKEGEKHDANSRRDKELKLFPFNEKSQKLKGK